MKLNQNSKRWLPAALAAMGLATFVSQGLAAVPDATLGTFDTDLGGYFVWGRGWGGETAVEWNASGNPGGCLTARGLLNSTNSDTPVCIYAVNAGNPWWHPNPPFDISEYKAIEFDIRWNNDPTNMPLNEFNYPSGDPAVWATMGIEIGSLPSAGGDGSGYVTLTNMPIPSAAAGAWVHVTIPIDPTKPGLTTSYGLWIRKWICNPPSEPGGWQTGHVVTNNGYYEFSLDNVVLIGGAPLPPPTMSAPAPAHPGENFIAASAGQWDRQEIRTVSSNYSWIGASGPVTYSVDVTKVGESAAPAILFFHWVPGGANPSRNDSDWHERNVLMWRIGNNADGSAWSSLHYKTNAPDDNGHLYDSGNLGGPGSATAKGTWSITFNGDTAVTMTSADGTTATANLPPEVITIFQATPGMQVNIGHVPNSGPTPVGQISVVTGAKFTGTPTALDSDFLAAPPDTSVWSALPNGPSGVQWLPPTSKFWLAWTLPATGFSLQSRASLTSGGWTGLDLAGYAAGGKHHVLLTESDVPGADTGFFRLLKRVGTKLQVLMPGETAAPGTPTGKTGTPTPLTAGEFFSLTVRLVDDEWYPVTTPNDEVSISAPDDAYLYRDGNPTPATALMMNGVATFTQLQFLNAGSWSVTATNVSRPEILPNTGSPVTVNW